MSLTYDPKLIPKARALRKNMTRQERRLWYEFLNKYKPRFQRQKAIDNFIADFYCHEARLIIEIDGSQHFTDGGMAYDSMRSNILTGYDLAIMRFTNRDIDNNFEGVCAMIDFEVKSKGKAQTSSPRPSGASPFSAGNSPVAAHPLARETPPVAAATSPSERETGV